jgi:hypothetical protein
MEITIIGTDPPCARCDILDIWVNEILAEKGLDSVVKVIHLVYDSPEATAYGEKIGLKIGTAKTVAAAAGMAYDKPLVEAWKEKRKDEIGDYKRPADLWNEDFDRLFSQYQEVADSLAYIMTPVLVIDGEVKHHSSVPNKNNLREWLAAAKQEGNI